MAENSKIEWTDATWNPILGCSKISPGCKNCYAIRTAWRLSHNPNPKVHEAFKGLTVLQGGDPNWTGKVNFVPDRLAEPLRWKKPRRIFVNSQSDLFHERVTDVELLNIFAVMGNSHIATGAENGTHTFQVLTKRHERMRDFMSKLRWGVGLALVEYPGWRGMLNYMPFLEGMTEAWVSIPGGKGGKKPDIKPRGWQPENIWLGVSVESPQYKERIYALRKTSAAVRMLSLEPLLEDLGKVDLRGIHWCIVGGESGPKARPMHPAWARSLRDQCVAAGVAFFFKQWGEWSPGENVVGGQKYAVKSYFDGKWREDTDDWISEKDGGPLMYRIGKKSGGRALDGKEWSQYPEIAAV